MTPLPAAIALVAAAFVTDGTPAPPPCGPVDADPVPVLDGTLRALEGEGITGGGGEPADDDLRALYRSGRGYTDFLGQATRRTELWHDNTERAAAVDPALLARARAVGGTWYFLAVAIDSCSDSVSTIPYLAELVALVDGLDMRVVDPTAGRAIMEAHPTPDGRPATPTVLLLDADFDEAGCFIERPPLLQNLILENPDWSSRQVYERKMEWYDRDGGRGTVEAFVEMLEAAAAGRTVCR